jgi:hypothetical protein
VDVINENSFSSPPKCNKHADWRHVRSCATYVHRKVLIAGDASGYGVPALQDLE